MWAVAFVPSLCEYMAWEEEDCSVSKQGISFVESSTVVKNSLARGRRKNLVHS